MKYAFNFLFTIAMVGCALAQNNNGYWQQKVDYKMEIDVNIDSYQYKGEQELIYTNNSPDTLYRVFYHLYFNAFQPGSDMDIQSLSSERPDPRVADRISKLTPSEIGYIRPTSLRQDGTDVSYKIEGTILEVNLNTPILPGSSTKFTMTWDAQVPVQIRRSGRNSSEGVALSMSQWYPKLAEYDSQGWHADSYIGREFYGVWGDFDVKISIDSEYTIGGTGYLQNPNEIGHGYQDPGVRAPKHKKGKKLTWHFIAPNVHDFTWGADNEYVHDVIKGPNDVDLHFFYKNKPELTENWKNLQEKTAQLLEYFNENLGEYPYKQYSVIQGGDGGMEYAMCTLITGERNFGSLVGVTSHELAHTWFQFLLATNEARHAWMDEGFTSFISDEAMNVVMDKNEEFPHFGSYQGYQFLAKSGLEQPLTTHADRFKSGRAYGISAYSKGAVFLSQLEYVIGEENLKKSLKRYYEEWKFKHPTPENFIRVAEKVSGFELDWYLIDFGQTTNTIDYGIKRVMENYQGTTIELERIGLMPMPIDLTVQYEDGSKELFYIPLQMMRAEKPFSKSAIPITKLKDWAWANPLYSFEINGDKKVKEITIDASRRMADINLDNNFFSSN